MAVNNYKILTPELKNSLVYFTSRN